jgi:drug/metabolite transporter (DMT)-like permease
VASAALVLVLTSALLHASWNALLKRGRNVEALSMGISVVALVLTAGAVPWLPGRVLPGHRALGWALGAGLFEGCYFLALIRALERAPLGFSYTWMRGGAVLVVWPLSMLFLGEAVTVRSALAVAVVCLGLGCMGLGSGRHFRGWAWAATAGLFIGLYTLCYKLALDAGGHPVALFATACALSLPIQLAVRVARHGPRTALAPPEQMGLALLAGVLCTASFVLYLQALAMAGAGAVSTLRNTSVVFAVLCSWSLGEKPGARQ